jgi:hypothetical protein
LSRYCMTDLWPPRPPNSSLVGSTCTSRLTVITTADNVFIAVMLFRFTSWDRLHLWMYQITPGNNNNNNNNNNNLFSLWIYN